MSKKIRLIARFDVKDTNLVKGIQLEGLRKLGDPNAFAKEYYEAGIDELLYIDIVASLYNRNNLSDIVRKTVDDVYIPVCVAAGCAASRMCATSCRWGRTRLPSTRRPSSGPNSSRR